MLKAERLTKRYDTPAGPLPILEGIDFALSRGESAAIMGPSGSGKSTLLYLLGALDRPTSGSVIVNDTDVAALNEARQAEFRNRHIGFVFQDHALLPQCTILENVLIPTLVADGAARHTERARGLVEAVGLAPRIEHKPGQLSGGERQRVAIARALIMQPAVLLCDEPTGNLDRASAETVADLLMKLHRDANSVLVVVTHNPELAERFPSRYELRDCALHRLA